MKNGLKIFLILNLVLFISNSLFSQAFLDTIQVGEKGRIYQVDFHPGATYNWMISGGKIISGNGSNLIIVDWGTQPGIFLLKVSETNVFGCRGDTISSGIFIQGKTTSNMYDEICRGTMAHFQADSGSLYKNNHGELTDQISFIALRDTVLSLFLLKQSRVVDSLSQYVTVLEAPQVDFLVQAGEYVINKPVQVAYRGQQSGYLEWSFENDHAPIINQTNVSYTYSTPGEKNIKLVFMNAAGCSDTLMKILTIKEESNHRIHFPDAFSPNDDGINDVFLPFIKHPELLKQFSLEIFDRWGKRVFESQHFDDGWNGIYQEEKSSIGIYIFVAHVSWIDGEMYSETSNLTLSR